MTVLLITSLPAGLPRYWMEITDFFSSAFIIQFCLLPGTGDQPYIYVFFITTEIGLTNAFDVFPAGLFCLTKCKIMNLIIFVLLRFL